MNNCHSLSSCYATGAWKVRASFHLSRLHTIRHDVPSRATRQDFQQQTRFPRLSTAVVYTLLDVCMSSLRRGRSNLLFPSLTDDPRRESVPFYCSWSPRGCRDLGIRGLADSQSYDYEQTMFKRSSFENSDYGTLALACRMLLTREPPA